MTSQRRHRHKTHLELKFPTKRIFQTFNIWKTNRMTLFCNLFIERVS